jgi:hypothetical protein
MQFLFLDRKQHPEDYSAKKTSEGLNKFISKDSCVG